MHLLEEHKWPRRFLKLAQEVATWSKDPNTKVGAVIVDERNRIVGLGYNGFPRGVADSPALYSDRESKLSLVVHAEANAILNSNRVVSGCHLYTSLPPCNECAKLIIQAGISRVSYEASERVSEISTEMFRQAGVEICGYC